ncbi:hypothetical protein GIB67_017938 [Kingdonia uniflora]|uniref:Germin-like protein n=1 Tax=Kingdonia uniflora TaxID=39325 RepID=A0A7J7NE55_9MAGN|nr:hypothetical protein GIB67_017938 [Kingdonia uniflora]
MGVNSPHTHPRASEILTVLEGTLYVCFVTSNPENRMIAKTLQKGDAFVFPVGLIHFQRNVGYGNAVAIAALSSQNPGVISIAKAVLGSTLRIATEVEFIPFPQPPPLGVVEDNSLKGSVDARSDDLNNPFASLGVETKAYSAMETIVEGPAMATDHHTIGRHEESTQQRQLTPTAAAQ